MKIALVADPLSPHTRAWVMGLAERGHEVHLFSPHRGWPAEALPARLFIPLAPPAATGKPPAGSPVQSGAGLGKPPRGMRDVWELRSITRALRLSLIFRRWLRQLRPDRLVALRFQPEGYLAALGGFRPLIIVSWGQDVLWFALRHPLHRLFARRAIRSADRLFGETEAVLTAMCALGARPERCRLAFIGVEAGFWAPPAGKDTSEIRRDLLGRHPSWAPWLESEGPGAQFLLSPRAVGFHGHQKELIEAWSRLAHGLGPKAAVPFLLQAGAGSPRERGECAELAARLGLASRYVDLGLVAREDLRELYWLSDAAVSLWAPDGLAASLLETMASGTLPVAADLPGNREWITPGENGLLVDPKVPESIHQALELALRDSGLRTKARERNLALIRARADRGPNLDLLVSLIVGEEGA